MDEQRSFPSALFGFDREAVLSYIYEVDASHKEAEDELNEENKQLKAALEEAVSRLEEATSQYEIIKAQLYNAKEEAESAKAGYERLKQETAQAVTAAGNKDKELQIQLELNKKFQARCANLQGELQLLGEKLAKSGGTDSGSSAELSALRGELHSFKSGVAKKLAEFDAAIARVAPAPRQGTQVPRQETPEPKAGEDNRFFR